MSDLVPVDPGNLPDVSQTTLHGLLRIFAGEPADLTFPHLRPQIRGGLPPRTLRRVREYIEAHLEDNISLQELAGMEGLSTSHFGRAFKQSEGVAPHRYLLQCRVRNASGLLADTELPLSEIAIASGFADQSHFCRQFSKLVGATPSTYRWSMR
jgi:transcriptional regulator GlxA family with amidase domain